MDTQNRLAADIGGTFTDVAAFDAATGKLRLGKALSTPQRMVDGIEAGAEKAGAAFAETAVFLHGSTVVINTLLERKGARTALITTEGFRDVYEIGRINRPDAYNLFFRKHTPLVRRSLRFEVRERVLASGAVRTPLNEEDVHAVCDRLAALEIEAVAILFLHCYANPAHELRARDIVRERLPGVFVTASHELSQEYREYERCSTTAANAYVGPIVQRYLQGIEERLEARGFGGAFLVMQSTGGLYGAAQARTQCVRMLESGPAAGVIGAQALCRELGMREAIAFDMGGTTAKAGVILEGKALTATTAMVGGYHTGLPIQMPLVDVFEVGAGGGSIAHIDVGGALRVGPGSAGAEPGPACYGRGGAEPTVTDANLALGRLGADRFLGGEMRLDAEAARRAIETRIAAPLGLSLEEAAAGVLRIAVTKMSHAVKGVSTERGLDAAAFPLIAYGGAGPLHACAIAREIGIKRVLIPRAPGHFCAFGMLHSDLRYDSVRTWPHALADVSFVEIEAVLKELAAEGRARVESAAVGYERVMTSYAADMRYVGQEHAVTVDLAPDLHARDAHAAIKAAFDAVHLQRYGTCAPEEPVELVSLRASVCGVMPKPAMEDVPRGRGAPEAGARLGVRPVYFSAKQGWMEAPVFSRPALRAGNRIAGPALIEEHASTAVLGPGDVLTVDRLGNLDIEIGAEP